jgi:hypothetical protein
LQKLFTNKDDRQLNTQLHQAASLALHTIIHR